MEPRRRGRGLEDTSYPADADESSLKGRRRKLTEHPSETNTFSFNSRGSSGPCP